MTEALRTAATPAELRARLESLFIGDLLGPAGGESEELKERNARDRYIVGVLAPSRVPKQDHAAPMSVAESGNADDDDDEDDDYPQPHEELAEGGSDTAEDGGTDRDVTASSGIMPSSIGMTFSIRQQVTSFQVHVSWGQYCREVREGIIDERTGRATRVMQRYPRGGTVDIPLQEAMLTGVVPDPEFPDVQLQVRMRRRQGFWVITLFLRNDQLQGKPKDEFFLFQPKVKVTATDDAAIFCRRPVVATGNELEDRIMAMQYRRQVEFAVGHGVSVHAEVSPQLPTLACSVETTFLPRYEVESTSPPSADDATVNAAFGKLSGLVLDMQTLAEADAAQLQRMLTPLSSAYEAWISSQLEQRAAAAGDLLEFGDAPEIVIQRCQQTLGRIQQGLQLLKTDPQALKAFQFMNRSMWLQRTHSLYSDSVRRGQAKDFDTEIDLPKNRSWRTFQLAFILINLPAMTQLDHADRMADDPGNPESVRNDAVADLLFFPTGGGKTEAYLGLAAYTMGLRRLQGIVGGRVGDEGVAVLMRYTLRLLTIQQFQRATALVCACEQIRRKALESGDQRWGKTPFRIGLWVGRKTTPNRTADADEAIKQLRGNQYSGSQSGSPYQLTSCPWCGSAIEAGRHLEASLYPNGSGRTLTYCSDRSGQCLFSRRQASGEGLPIVVVDEEIYRRLPTLLIATVDKFAQMPWKGEVQMLFGQVTHHCERHGFKSPEVDDRNHPKRGAFPSTRLQEHPPLRPPDLIIQDELHLISGPLGSLVGLYETAVDHLCTWEVNGKRVRPKVIASTATIKNAAEQVHSLFQRRVNVFPPPGLDITDNFFSLQRKPSDQHFSRLYLGVCAPGRRLKAVMIQVYVSLLCAAKVLYDNYEEQADPWMTLVGYFNSMRELGGMRRLADDSVPSRARKQDRRGLAARILPNVGTQELTSRMRSDEIPRILDRLSAGFSPAAERARQEAKARGDWKNAPEIPIDILLATNMISVGVDVSRLGLMVVTGQPKATAEYIQATSRVGRASPGLVVTVLHWARPRDLSHFETFEHYHSTFYKQVEPLSVTPFSPGAIDRGLAGLLVSLVRLGGTEFNGNEGAFRMSAANPMVQQAIETIARRAELVGDGTAVGDKCRDQLKSKADHWQAQAQNVEGGRRLHYQRTAGMGSARDTAIPLLGHAGTEMRHAFTCLNSLRDVEPTVPFVLIDGNLDSVKPVTGAVEEDSGSDRGQEGGDA